MAPPETQYLLPGRLDAVAASELLAAHLDLESEGPRSVDRRYYDTFDGRLHGEGLTFVHEDGTLMLLDRSGNARSVADQRTAPKKLYAGECPPGPLRELLGPIVDVRALLPIARVRSRTYPMRVLDDEAKTVARLVLEEPELVGPAGARTRLEARVRVLPVRGYDKALTQVQQTLERELDLTEAAVSIRVEAVVAAGGTPGGFSSKLEPRERREEPADRAAAAALAGPLFTMRATLPGTLGDVDSEFLHDFRVAVRRTRSLQRQLAPVFSPERLAHFRAEFRWLQQVTGPVRDLDVHQLELSQFRTASSPAVGDDLQALADMLAQRRRTEFRRMVRALKSRRAQELLDAWASFLDELPDSPAGDRPEAGTPIAELAATRIRKVYRQMVRMGSEIDDASPPEALHDLRKKGKELRYLLEFFAGLFPAEIVKPMVRRLKSLQDVLGRYQDQEIQAATLRALGEDLGGREGGPAALMAMGVLVRRLDQDHADARGEFKERFDRFAAKDQRKLVKATFA